MASSKTQGNGGQDNNKQAFNHNQGDRAHRT